MRKLLLAALVMAGGIMGSTLFPVSAAAATAPAVSGIVLSPAIQDKVLGPNEISANFTFQLTNETDVPVRFALSSADFTALNQSGGLTFTGSDSRAVTEGHGLSNVLQLDAAQLTLAPRETKTITARIPNVKSLAPGGHYAAVLAQALPNGQAAGSDNKVAINQVVSSLVFLETAGQGTKSLKLLKPNVAAVQLRLPEQLNLAFQSTGNTQTIPRGVVTITKGDTEISSGIINQNSSLILPGSTRLLPVNLNSVTKPFWPGKYQLSVQYRYDRSLGVTSYQTEFIYINLPFLVLLAILLIGLLLVVIRKRSSRQKAVQPTEVDA